MRYHWQEGSVCPEVDLLSNLTYPYARLHLGSDISGEQQRALPARLQKRGLVALPECDGDHAVLRVRGFADRAHLFTVLREEGLVSGAPTASEPLPEELHKEVRGFRQYLRDHSIQLAGAVYLIADAMPILSGITRRTPSEVMTGGAFATTSMALLLFGRKHPDVQMGNMYSKLADFMAREGVPLPDDQALALRHLQRDPSYWNGLLNFLYEHPVLFNNSIQGYGCLQLAQAGHSQQNPWKRNAGLMQAAGQFGGLLVPEDKYAGLPPEEKADRMARQARGEVDYEDGYQTAFTDNPIAWVREKPLRLTAIGPIIGNFLIAGGCLFHDRHRVNEFFQQYDPERFASQRYELNPNRLLRDFSRGKDQLLAAAGLSREELKADAALPAWQRKHTAVQNMINVNTGNKFTVMSPIFNMIANTLYGMSSKDERSVNLDKEGYLDEIIAVAANVYAHLPESDRGERIIRFAGFLKSQPDMQLSEKEIRARVQSKIDALAQCGWVDKLGDKNAPQPSAALG